MAIPKEKRPYIKRGTKILKEIREIEAKPMLTNDDKRLLKHLYEQFNIVFDYVFTRN